MLIGIHSHSIKKRFLFSQLKQPLFPENNSIDTIPSWK